MAKGRIAARPQRVRDPLHNLIEFDAREFEQAMWAVIQTRPFQRLRRVKQLGFSEFVFPGATHTRFAHSLGVFHTARRLMRIIKAHLGDGQRETRIDRALAAALLHDVGHGPFSHAFESVGKKLNLPMARHEDVSQLLIQSSEIAETLQSLGTGFATDVAKIIGRKGPDDIYDAVVSSQFDADRLDYMRRDRFMTGVESGGIDFEWLMANLKIGPVPLQVDNEKAGTIDTFVLGPKASLGAEAYILGLFHLYPNIYFHKTTRGAEKVFSALLERFVNLTRDGHGPKTGLEKQHPLTRFIESPADISLALDLDDTVITGALSMLAAAEDKELALLALQLRDRKLPKCIDIRERVIHNLYPTGLPLGKELSQAEDKVEIRRAMIEERIDAWCGDAQQRGVRVLIDEEERHPYRRYREDKGPLNQIRIMTSDGTIVDAAEHSPVVAALSTYRLFRAYVRSDDTEAREKVSAIISTTLAEMHGK